MMILEVGQLLLAQVVDEAGADGVAEDVDGRSESEYFWGTLLSNYKLLLSINFTSRGSCLYNTQLGFDANLSYYVYPTQPSVSGTKDSIWAYE